MLDIGLTLIYLIKMAKKTTEKPTNFCKDCANCSDYHNKSLKGDYILGKCAISGLSVLLNHDYCKEFKQK